MQNQTRSFYVVVQDVHAPAIHKAYLKAEVHVTDGKCIIRNIHSTTRPSFTTVYKELGAQDPDTWAHYMSFSEKPSEKPSWVSVGECG